MERQSWSERKIKIEARIWNLEAYLHTVKKGELNDCMKDVNIPKAKRQLRYWKKQLEKKQKGECPNCKKQNCFRPLKQDEIVSMRDTLAKDGGTHLLCVECDYLIPKDQIIA